MIVLAAPAPIRVTSAPMHSAVVLTSKSPNWWVRNVQLVAWLSTYVPAGTTMVLASERPLALMIAPRRLQSFGAASVQAVAAGSSTVVSTVNVAARDGGAAPRIAASTAGMTKANWRDLIRLPPGYPSEHLADSRQRHPQPHFRLG